MQAFARIFLSLMVLALVANTLMSCTAGPNPLAGRSDATIVVAGFWRGLWHGFICLFTLIASVFSRSVNVYEIHNNGAWYNFGFVLGTAMFFRGGARSKGKRCANVAHEGRKDG